MLTLAVAFLDRVFGRKPESNEAQPRKLNACVVHAGGLLGIVGESYRQDELRVLSGRTTDASAFREYLVDYAAEVAESEPDRRWFMAVLAREPDNPKDPDAVAVHARGGGKLGYLARENARRYGRVFESLEKRGYEAAACPAMLTGAGSGESYGVVLAISAPGYVLGDLTADERDAVRESKAREKDARDRTIYEAALAGETWETVAEAHGYKTAGGARAAAHRYAERNGLEMPPHNRGPRRQTD
jgi:HIRAN domain